MLTEYSQYAKLFNMYGLKKLPDVIIRRENGVFTDCLPCVQLFWGAFQILTRTAGASIVK
jgi:hypothetical protein